MSRELLFSRRFPQSLGSRKPSLLRRRASSDINFCGRYEFSKMPEAIDMDAIIHQLAQVPI